MFIVIEGIDGSGKTTLAKNLTKEIDNSIYTREPGGEKSHVSEEIRDLIFKHNDLSPITEVFLFTSSRIEHLKRCVDPELKQGKIVICDRFYHSSMAYQGQTKKVGVKLVLHINKNGINQVLPHLVHPDIVFYLKINPEVAQKRRLENNSNYFDKENLDFYNQTYLGYEEAIKLLTPLQKIFILDGSKTQDALLKEALEIFNKVKADKQKSYKNE